MPMGLGCDVHFYSTTITCFKFVVTKNGAKYPKKKEFVVRPALLLSPLSPSNPLHGDMRLQRFLRTRQELLASTASLASLKALMHFIPTQAKWSHNPSATLTD